MPENLDWSFLNNKMNPSTDKVNFDSVKHLVHKVAFDVYKMNDSSESLWELRDDDDGTQYLVALYDEPADIVIKSQEDKMWTATADHEGKNVTLSYKDFPIERFAIAEHGVAPKRADEFARFIENKARDKEFVAGLVASMPKQKKTAVLQLLGEEDS